MAECVVGPGWQLAFAPLSLGKSGAQATGRAMGHSGCRAHPGSWGSLALEAVGGSLSRFPFLCHFLFHCVTLLVFFNGDMLTSNVV